MKKIFLLLFLPLLYTNTFAECVIRCMVRYQYEQEVQTEQMQGKYFSSLPIVTSGGLVWSQYYTTDITFYSGYEYGGYFSENSIIAVVKRKNGGESVIKINKWKTQLKNITQEEVNYDNATGK